MNVHEIGKTNSVFNQFIAELRDEKIQKDPIRFRKNMERVSMLIGYEISKQFDYRQQTIITPLGESKINLATQQPIIASILRAGLSMHQGLLEIFDGAENAFISAFREKTSDQSIRVKVEYMAAPSLIDKTLIIADPMLATGLSMSLAYESLLKNGIPSKTHIVSAIASRDSIKFLEEKLPANTEIWVGAIDPILNEKAYIIPGLGDAGDLAYGLKE